MRRNALEHCSVLHGFGLWMIHWMGLFACLSAAQFSQASPEIAVYRGAYASGDSLVHASALHNFIPTATGGSSAAQAFTIRNLGTLTLTVTGLSMGGLDQNQFVLDAAGSVGSLAPGATATFTIHFSPTETGIKIAQVEISSDDADEGVFRIHLAGFARPSKGGVVLGWGKNYSGQTTFQAGLNDVVAIAAGHSHSLALKSDGMVAVWGDNSSNQRSIPAGLGGVVAVAAGGHHNLALKSDQNVVAWGSTYGTVPANLSDVVAVAAGSAHNLALKSDGTVVAWGDNSENQSTVPTGLNGVVAVAAGYEHSLALKRDGTVVAWGYRFGGVITVPADLTGVTALSAGAFHSLALKGDGMVVAWGSNFNGRTAVPPGLNNVVGVAASWEHSLAVKSDGSVAAWGANNYNQLNVPGTVVKAVAVAAGEYHSLALVNSPEIAVHLGSDTSGSGLTSGTANPIHLGVIRLGQPSTAQTFTIINRGEAPLNLNPLTLSGTDAGHFILDTSSMAESLAPGDSTTFSLAFRPTAPGARNIVLSLVSNDLDEGTFQIPVSAVGISTITAYRGSVATVLPISSNAGVHNFQPTLIGASSASQIFTIHNSGTNILTISDISLGGTDAGQFTLGQSGSTVTSLLPDESATITVAFHPSLQGLHQARVEVANSDPEEPTLIIHLSGTGLSAQGRTVTAWGDNSSGQCNVPAGLSDVVAVQAGTAHSLALKSDGTVVAWGATGSGAAIVPDDLASVLALAAGDQHNLALKGDSTVVAWGFNPSGQTTVPPGLSGVVALAAGQAHSLALKSDGTVVAWGANVHNQATVPFGLRGVVAIAAGGSHNLALKSDGTVVAWGYNGYNQATVPTNLADVVALVAGRYHNLALRSNGTVVGWGANDQNQRSIPSNLSGVTTLAAGDFHSLAVQSSGVPHAWGSNIIIHTFDVTTTNQSMVPAGLSDVIAIAGGQYHSLAAGAFPVMTVHAGADATAPPISNGAASPQYLGSSLLGTTTAGRSFTIWNQGTATLNLSSPVMEGPDASFFMLDTTGMAASIAPGASTSFTVTYQPATLGLKTANLKITSNDIESPEFEFAVSAIGTSAVAVYQGDQVSAAPRINNTGAHNFMPTAAGSGSSVQTFTLRNAGTTNLTLHSMALGGSGSGQFIIHAADSASSLEPGETTTFSVSFQPQQTGLHQAKLEIASDDATEPVFQIHLAGVGRADHGNAVLAWGLNDFGQSSVPFGLRGVASVAAGEFHSLALKADGTLAAWGKSSAGQTTVPPGLTDVLAVAAGGNHSLALKADGTVVAWGHNAWGASTVPSGLNGVVAVAAGRMHNLALRKDGTVVAWGGNTANQAIVPAGLSGVVAVAAGFDQSLALKSDGSIIAWGKNSQGQPVTPPALEGVSALAVGIGHCLALKNDGSVTAWGNNTHGQTSVPASLGAGVKGISAGYEHSLALKSDGSVAAWGRNNHSQSTVPAGLTEVEALSAAGNHTLALVALPDIAVHAGEGTSGPLLNSGSLQTLGSAAVGVTGSEAIFTILNFGTADLRISSLTLEGIDAGEFALNTSTLTKTLAPGESTSFTVALAPSSRGLKSAVIKISSNAHEAANFLIPVSALCPSAISIHRGSDAAAEELPDAGVHVFRSQQLGTSSQPQTFTVRNLNDTGLTIHGITLSGNESSQFILAPPDLPATLSPGESISFTITFHPAGIGLQQAMIGIVDVDAGGIPFYFHLAGTGQALTESPVLAWGENSHGQCTLPPALSKAVAVAAGDVHSLALKSDGTIAIWGINQFIPEGLSDVVAMAAGAMHSLALKSDGTVVAWGRGATGLLPVPEGLTDVVAVAAGRNHSLALKSNGTIVAWGENHFGQADVPPGLKNVMAVVAGRNHNVALKTDGSFVIWGENLNGANTPPDGLRDVMSLAANKFNLALKKDGTVVAWGNGVFNVPTGLNDVVNVSTSWNRGAALKADGTIVTMGEENPNIPGMPTGMEVVTAVTVGELHTVALGRVSAQLPQTIHFTVPATIHAGQAVPLNAWANSGLAVNLEIISGQGDMAEGRLISNTAGTLRIRATQPGNGFYKEAAPVVRTIAVKAPPSISTPPKLVLLNLTQIYDGRPKSVTVLGAPEEPTVTYAGSMDAPIQAGKYPVRVTVPSAGRTTTASATLTILKAPLWVRVENKSRLIHQANPRLTFSYQGFQGNDDEFTIQAPPVASTTARPTSIAGSYPITTRGGLAANYHFIHLPGTLTVVGFGATSFEGLALHPEGLAALTRITFNAACTSFTAKVSTSWEKAPLSFSGPLTLDAGQGVVSAVKAIRHPATDTVYGIGFAVDLSRTLYWALGRGDVESEPFAFEGMGRALLGKPATPVTYRGTYTLLLEPPQTAAGLPPPPDSGPQGSGWAAATITPAGVLKLAGVLGDGTTFTAALPPDIDPEPGYRLFVRSTKSARAGSFLSGEFNLKNHPHLTGRGHLPEASMMWSKTIGKSDATYPNGFDNLSTTAILDPWQAPSKTTSLASLLGLPNTPITPLQITHSSTGSALQDANLPTVLNLTGTRLAVPASLTSPAKWQARLNAANGLLTGSFELQDALNKKLVVKFKGTLRQPSLATDSLIGGGHFILPPLSGVSGKKPTTGDIILLKPASAH